MAHLTSSLETLELVSIQYEITHSLNASMDIKALCRRYMETCIRRLSVKAVHLYIPKEHAEDLFEQSEISYKQWGRFSMPSRHSCLPEQVPEIKRFVDNLIKQPPPENKIVTQQFIYRQTYYHTFTLRDRAVLVIERADSALPSQIINALIPAVRDLFYVCSSSLQHAQVVNEVERRKQAEYQLKFLAFHDELTGLPNRVSIINTLNQELKVCKANLSSGALIYIDLDGFRDINDSLGHRIGDLLLRKVSERLSDCCEQEQVLSRISSDEFVIFCPSSTYSNALIDKMLKKVSFCFEPPFIIGSRSMEISASIGVTRFSHQSSSAYSIFMQSDLAMSKAKRNSGVSIEFYQSEMELEAKRRFKLDTDMRKALNHNEFSLFIQPQVDQHGVITGGEALIRWQHPELGFISPLEFIGIAEKTGFIVPLGEWVIKQACQYLEVLQQRVETQHLKIAVNLSTKQFYQSDFIDNVSRIVENATVPSTHVELELTESVMLEDTDLAVSKINHLKSLGFEISIDDFGTGYSSLSYLKHLPINTIKIDRSFVTHIEQHEDNQAIVEAIMLMARRFKLGLIAEGVERLEEVISLKEMGCDAFQGYYFYKPMPFDEFLHLFES